MTMRNLLSIAAITLFAASTQATAQDQCKFATGHVSPSVSIQDAGSRGNKITVTFSNAWHEPVSIQWSFSDTDAEGFVSPVRVSGNNSASVTLYSKNRTGRAVIHRAITCK